MPISRLNHAVLYVRDLERSVAFYRDVLGFRRLDMTPDGFAGRRLPPGRRLDQRPRPRPVRDRRGAGASAAGRSTVGLYHLAWEVDTLAELERLRRSARRARRARRQPATTGPPRACTARTPTAWSSRSPGSSRPTASTTRALAARKQIGRLDLDREKQRYGVATVGGV